MDLLGQIGLIFGLYVFFGLFEVIRPWEKEQPLTGRLRNVLYTLLFLVIGGIVTLLMIRLIPWRAPGSGPRSPLVTFLMVILAIFVWDFLFYWYHRAEHAFGWLWEIHKLHHSDVHLNVSTSLRHSWIESPLQSLLISTPVAIVFSLDDSIWLVFSVVTTLWLLFVHTNIRLHLGVLTPFVGGPQVHRIHHSIEEKHQNKNFAVYFPIIDKVFGTYYAPAPDEFAPTGTHGMPSDVPWTKALVGPFIPRKGRIEKIPLD